MHGALVRARTFGVASALAIASLGVVGVVPAAATTDGTQTWTITVGSGSFPYTALNRFYPNDITVHAGDNVDFKWQGFHTVTFNMPANLSLLDVGFPPGPPGNSTTLDTPTTFVSAVPMGGGPPPAPPPADFVLKVGNDLPSGAYQFACRFHQFMKGVIRVKRGDLPKTDGQNQTLAAARMAADATRGAKLDARLIKQSAHWEGEALVGAGDKVTELFNFYPSFYSLSTFNPPPQPPTIVPNYIKIKVGDELTFTTRDLHEPHTVTFGEEPAGGPFAAVPPSGTGDPNAYDGTSTLNSGFMFAQSQYDWWNLKHSVLSSALPRTTFSVTFTTPGLFPFYCALHGSNHGPNEPGGMSGTIQVLPADASGG